MSVARWSWVLVLLPGVAAAATDGPGKDLLLRAVRTTERPRIDGRVDEQAWQAAPVFDGFVQSFPEEGRPPSERTELRVLYDDDNLYVSMICFDSQPEKIAKGLGRRDNPPVSDRVSVAIDSRLDHRTAYAFQVNAAGVQLDARLFQDTQMSVSWDAVWEADTAMRPDGWSAELRLPMHLFQPNGEPELVWGFHARRQLTRTHEDLDSVPLPHNQNAVVSLFAHLEGVRSIPASRDVELSPYVAARVSLAPEGDAPAPRVIEPSVDLGADLRAQISGGLMLNATLNPDFGQVEADKIILNLSNSEVFFPEKRPFFLEGMDLFQPVGAVDGRSPQTLFYSRRIGLDTPILGAAKVTGALNSTTQLGLVDAVVNDGWSPPREDGLRDRRWSWQARRPLHLSMRDSLAQADPVPRNYLTAVLRNEPSPDASLGASYASAVALVDGCQTPRRRAACDFAGTQAAALDWHVHSRDGEWVWFGQTSGSVAQGGPAERLLGDGTAVHPGDGGAGLYTRLGKLGGEPFRFQLGYDFASPALDYNATGYVPLQNVHRAEAFAQVVRTGQEGLLREYTVTLGALGHWTADGRGLYRGGGAWLEVAAQTSTFDWINCGLNYDPNRFDIREIPETGIPVERPGDVAVFCGLQTDGSRLLAVGGYVASAYHFAEGPSPATSGLGAELGAALRPHATLETRLVVDYDYTPHGPRYFETLDAEHFRLGSLESRFVSVTLRQLVVLTRTLTLQAYLQLFTSLERFNHYFAASSVDRSPIVGSQLVPVAGEESVTRGAALNANLVLRWEYRPGSTLFVVYSRAQEGGPAPTASGVRALWPDALLTGTATDSFMVKWTYWWG